MKNFIVAIGILSLLVSTQCKNQKNVVMTQSERELINTGSFVQEVQQPDFTIKSAQIAGNTLTIVTEFTGEKGTHDFDLLWDGSLMKSMPPKAMFTLVHKSNQSGGRKKVEMTLTFNLTALAQKTGYDTVIIMLKDFPEPLTWKK